MEYLERRCRQTKETPYEACCKIWGVAQMVERRAVNADVVGSSPTAPAKQKSQANA